MTPRSLSYLLAIWGLALDLIPAGAALRQNQLATTNSVSIGNSQVSPVFSSTIHNFLPF